MRRFATPLLCFRLKKKSLFLVKTYGNKKEYLYRSFFGEVKLSDYFSLHYFPQSSCSLEQQFLLTQPSELGYSTLNESLNNLFVRRSTCGVLSHINTLVRN